MFKKVVSLSLIVLYAFCFNFQLVLAYEESTFNNVLSPKVTIELDGKNYTLEKELNNIYLINEKEKILFATIHLEGIEKRKITTMLRSTYSWTSPIEFKYSVQFKQRQKIANFTFTLIWEAISLYFFSGLPKLASYALNATVAGGGFLYSNVIDELPEYLYVTVKYKEQLGCVFRKYYIDATAYLDATRTNKWMYVPLNQEVFEGTKNDFTLPAACRL